MEKNLQAKEEISSNKLIIKSMPLTNKKFSIYELEKDEFDAYNEDQKFFDDYNQLFDVEFGFY